MRHAHTTRWDRGHLILPRLMHWWREMQWQRPSDSLFSSPGTDFRGANQPFGDGGSFLTPGRSGCGVCWSQQFQRQLPDSSASSLGQKKQLLWQASSVVLFLKESFLEAETRAHSSDHLTKLFSSVQFSSVSQLCPTLCDPMSHSTAGLPVHHQLPESTRTHVHWGGNAIQPSHPLLSPSPPALNPSQHQGLFKWVSSLHQVAKVLEFQLQHQSFQWIPRTDLL